MTIRQSNQDPPKRSFREEIEASEKETNTNKRDQLIVSSILRVAETESLDLVVDALAKITDSNTRQQVGNWLYFTRTQSAIKQNRLDEARRLALNVEELDQRAYLYAEIAKQSLDRTETDAQTREMLEEVTTAANKGPNTIVTARTLLAVAFLYTKIDQGRSLSVLADAIKSINRIEAPDFSRQSIFRKIEGRNFARYATFQTPGFTPESVFTEFGRVNLEDALYQATSLTDKSLRALTTLALADTCLQQAQRERKNDKTQPKGKP